MSRLQCCWRKLGLYINLLIIMHKLQASNIWTSRARTRKLSWLAWPALNCQDEILGIGRICGSGCRLMVCSPVVHKPLRCLTRRSPFHQLQEDVAIGSFNRIQSLRINLLPQFDVPKITTLHLSEVSVTFKKSFIMWAVQLPHMRRALFWRLGSSNVGLGFVGLRHSWASPMSPRSVLVRRSYTLIELYRRSSP